MGYNIVGRDDLIPRKGSNQAALETRILEMLPGDFEHDYLPEIDVEDGEMSDERLQKEAEDAWRRLVLGEIGKVSEKADDTREEVKALGVKIDHVDERLSTLYNKQITDKSELSEAVNENSNKIELTTNLAASTREELRKHVYDTENEELLKIAEKRAAKSQKIAIFSVAIAAVSVIFGVLMAILDFIGG